MFISKSIEIALTEVLKRIVYTVRRPMWESNSTSVYEPFAKYEHIVDMKKKEFCDRYITFQQYCVNVVILMQCPSLLSCDVLYPVWLNSKQKLSLFEWLNTMFNSIQNVESDLKIPNQN